MTVTRTRINEGPQADANGDWPARVVGTNKAEEYETQGGDRLVEMRGGNDVVFVEGGWTNGIGQHDINVYGGPGSDWLESPQADIGGIGGDMLFGGRGDDRLEVGGSARRGDFAHGEAGNDVFLSHAAEGDAPNLLDGRPGNDLFYPGWNDIIDGGRGRDEFYLGSSLSENPELAPQTLVFERGDSAAGPNKRDFAHGFGENDLIKLGDGEGAAEFTFVGDRTGQEGSIKPGQVGYYEIDDGFVVAWNDDGLRQALGLHQPLVQELTAADFIL